jgi:uncharacterized protein YggE
MSIRIARPTAAAAGIAVALAATFVAGGAAAALSQSAPVAPSEPSTAAGTTGTITVTGEGTVTVSPDTAVLNVGVEGPAATGAAAMDLLDERSSALTDALTGAGIAADDLQTTGLNLYSTYGDDGTTVTGYVASLQVSATIRDIDAIGATIDAAQTAVGEGLTLSGVTFSFADPESVLGDARADAVADAGTKAQQLAAAAGLTLGGVVSIVEGSATPPTTFMPAMADAAAASGPSISSGNLDLTATVTVTYATR